MNKTTPPNLKPALATAAALLVVGTLTLAATRYTSQLDPFTATATAGQAREFKVVGTWGMLEHWREREKPFWTQHLPEISNGTLTANARPMTELGLSGFELMRQLRDGSFDFVHGVLSNVAGDSPRIEGADLAAIVQDLPTYRRMLDAYRPVIEREFKTKFDSKLLMLYAWPSQQLWCNFGDKTRTDISLADLRGKKIRSFNATLGDLIEGLGGSAVTITFAEVVPALQTGVVDCGITGTLPAYNAKWYQVVTHNVRLRVGYVSSFMAVNGRVWDSLSPAQQQLLERETAALEEKMWQATAANDQRGMDCNAAGPCDLGEPGGMLPIEPTAADQATLRRILDDYVLKRWAQRCGPECAADWTQTAGSVLGLRAAAE
ncbi:MAG: TRAP transporter substrate-binding protein [Cellvibrionales bacterium]|nr:TRAP transporter substrate-binding protein [Cellvibrionales bacterium]